MQLLDPIPFIEKVSECGDCDVSDEPPVLEIPVVVPDFTSDDVWDAFSDFSGDMADLLADTFDEGASLDDLPQPVVSDEEFVGDGGDEPSLDNDSAGVSNPFDTPDPALAWRLANMPDEVFMAILLQNSRIWNWKSYLRNSGSFLFTLYGVLSFSAF